MDSRTKHLFQKAIRENDSRLAASIAQADIFDEFYQFFFEEGYQLSPNAPPEQFCSSELFQAILTADTKRKRIISQAIVHRLNSLALELIDATPEILTPCEEDTDSFLHLAAATNNAEIIPKLIQRGLHVETRDQSGCTSLRWCREETQAFDALLQAGANLNAQDPDGNSILALAAIEAAHFGSESPSFLRTRYLIQKGADRNIQNTEGLTAAALISDLKHQASQSGESIDDIQKVIDLLSN